MKWMMRFRRVGAEGDGCNVVLVECREGDLQEEKERLCADMERYSGFAWVCVEIVPVDRQKRRRGNEMQGGG